MDRLTPGPTLISRAYDAILDAICDGRLRPGTRIKQDQLADRLHVSRQPVGQAVSILKAQGFLRDSGLRGIMVPPVEREFFSSIYQLREALDPMAARLAAQQCTKKDVAVGRRLLSAGRRAARARLIEGVILTDARFHAWIYQLAGNPLLVETMALYWCHLRRGMGEVLRNFAIRSRIWDEHQAIFEAISEQDGGEAARRSLVHVRDAAERIVESIPMAPRATGRSAGATASGGRRK
jgi:DNA-binding GntR family transcriptional regulator